jgi:hypothetical protein
MGRHAATRDVAVGAVLGLTWAVGIRGWMAELARADLVWTFTWLPLVLLLFTGAVTGGLLGWSAYLRRNGVRAPGWLALAPVLLAPALLDAEIADHPVTDETGRGTLLVVVTALCLGYALSRHGWSVRRGACGLVAALGLAMTWETGDTTATVTTAREAWVSIYGTVFVVLLGLAAALPHPPTRRPLGAPAWIGLGALCGLAWACALRVFMAEVAADDSGVEWGLTFGYILLPGTVIGGLLGWAEVRRRRGARPRWPLICAPLLFAAVLVPALFDLDSFLEDGIGGGAIGVPVIAMLGGFAITGNARLWARALAGLGFVAGFTTWLLVATDVGGTAFALDTAHGTWVSTLYEALLVTFALGAAVPHRLPQVTDDVAATSPRRQKMSLWR